MDLIALAGVVVPTALALWALRLRRQDRKRSEASAVTTEARAERTEAIAYRAAVAAERVAVVMERQAVAAARAAPMPEVAWTVEHSEGDTYLLTNAGNGSAYDVRIDTGDLVVAASPSGLDRAQMDPGEGLQFMAARSWGTQNEDITVTWSAEPGGTERKTWRRPLPPRPSRAGHGF